jgi:Uncharacterized conserved protein (COG2071)
MIDRLSIRTRPPGWPVMYQTWDKLLFLHWPVAAERLQPLIAPRLSLDTFEGQAWVSVSPFTMWGIRPVLLPPLPVVSQSHELNVRTYVHADGVPGVWFFSLDASNTLAVLGARVALGLPYFRARMRLQERTCRHPVHLYPHAPRGTCGPVRGHLGPRRAAALATARLAGFLSGRALLPLHRALATALPRAHFPPPVAPPLRREALLHVNHAGISGPADVSRGPAAARAGRALPGRYLASQAALMDDLSPPTLHSYLPTSLTNVCPPR